MARSASCFAPARSPAISSSVDSAAAMRPLCGSRPLVSHNTDARGAPLVSRGHSREEDRFSHARSLGEGARSVSMAAAGPSTTVCNCDLSMATRSVLTSVYRGQPAPSRAHRWCGATFGEGHAAIGGQRRCTGFRQHANGVGVPCQPAQYASGCHQSVRIVRIETRKFIDRSQRRRVAADALQASTVARTVNAARAGDFAQPRRWRASLYLPHLHTRSPGGRRSDRGRTPAPASRA